MEKRQKSKKRWLWCVGGVIVIAVIVAGGLMLWHRYSSGTKGNEVSESGEKAEETVEMRERNSEVETRADEDDFAEEEVEKKKVVQYEADDPNVAEELSGVVSYAEVVDGVLMLRVSIDQYLTEGDCKLSLERGGAVVYSETVALIGDVATATCEGFDVPVSGLDGGDLAITVELSGGGKTGTIRGEVSL